ncbi:MAG: pyridoxal phosphate-dependent aminotransferase [Streptococcaceae bacterium]|jgi:aminotransferase|nr:pyridoxal phosphate-dependent aminotransferase [Streptococcaceae bacterium]
MTLTDKFNKNLAKIEVSLIRQFAQETAKIPGVLQLTLGEPDFYTPEHVKRAGEAAISGNQSHYTGMAGLIELRAAASQFVKKRYGQTYAPEDEVLVTIGVTEAISSTLLSILEPGDELLIPAPAFPAYEMVALIAGAKVVEIDTRADAFVLTPEKLSSALTEHPKAKCLVLNSPSNPTGVVYQRAQLRALADVLRAHEIFVLSDEVYSEINYTEAGHASISEFLRAQTIVLNGLSKSHAMTGWRLGFIFAPRELVAQLIKTHQYLVTAATTQAQWAGVEALKNGQNDALPMCDEYRRRRDVIIAAMEPLGFEIAKTDGAFYIFAKIPADLNQNDYDFCMDLAHSKAVACVPGRGFGPFGEGYIRLSYATSMDVVTEAMARLTDHVRALRERSKSV